MSQRLGVQLVTGITAVLVLMSGINLWVVWCQQQRELVESLHGKAQVATQQLISTRLFVARSQDRLGGGGGHQELADFTPTAFGRAVGDIFRDRTGVILKQTNFAVRDPANAPDAFEQAALARFVADPGLTEVWGRSELGDEPVFRYVAPLQMESECLSCHGVPVGAIDVTGHSREGYREGQLGGAISLTLPMGEEMERIRQQTQRQVAGMVAVTLVTLLVLYGLTRRLVTNPLEHLAAVAERLGGGSLTLQPGELRALRRNHELGVVASNIEAMAQGLHDLYTGLEAKVVERTRELEQASRLQTQFLTGISHELRTPLTSIIAFTELLLKPATGQQREYLQDVLDSSRHLLDMVNSLLDLSRLQAGRVQLFTEAVYLSEVLGEVDAALRPLAERKGIHLDTAGLSGAPLVLADPLRVGQVLVNLIGNAIKFTPPGGAVTVSAREDPGWLEVSVRDTGPGVAPEHREIIFVPFRRIETPGYRHPGTGLGLALCRSLVELHGGRIWVQAATGGGSDFRFTLPLAPAADEGRDGGDGQADPGGG